MLELNRPIRFPGHGKLTLRQIDRTLKRRRKLKRGTSLEELLVKFPDNSCENTLKFFVFMQISVITGSDSNWFVR